MRRHYVTHFHATYTGKGEFYSGIRSGERVLLSKEGMECTNQDGDTRTSCSLSIQSLDRPGAWLRVYRTALELTDISEFMDTRITYYDPTPGRWVARANAYDKKYVLRSVPMEAVEPLPLEGWVFDTAKPVDARKPVDGPTWAGGRSGYYDEV